MTYLTYIEILDQQPIGTFLIFNGDYPMARKISDGRWAIPIGYNLDKTILWGPLMVDGPAYWMDDDKTRWSLS